MVARNGRNPVLSKHIGRLGKAALARKRGLHKRKFPKAEPKAEEPAPTTKEVEVKGANNGGKRTVPLTKAPKFYPAEDERKPKVSRKTNRPARLRDSITPGTVLILLAGKHRGKRVVFVKQLQPSGLLLVTGPLKINGVPLRRVNQAYVIATSTKIDVSSVSLPESLTDSYFTTSASSRPRGKESEFFKDGQEKKDKKKDESRAADQKAVDKALLAEIAKVDNLAKYLSSTFSLSKGQYPHLLKF